MTFSKHFANWPLDGREHLNISHIETSGKDLDDFLANAQVSLETWHGGEGPDWDLGDLPDADYKQVEKLFAEFLAGA
jgi:hypothetical protein